jgi:electron transfer flavoprotein alpha subunit
MIARDLSGTGKVSGLEIAQTNLARAGADKVVVALTTSAVAPLWAVVGTAWQSVLDELRPRIVLFGADAPSATELAPRTGARIGARLFARARIVGLKDVELHDRDGVVARAIDGGAAVALIGRAPHVGRCDEDVDLTVIAAPGGPDPRIELAGTAPAQVVQTAGALVALGEDVAQDAQIAADARRLASRLGGQLVGGAAAPRVEQSTPLAPELCVAIGSAELDLAGATGVIRIGAPAGKTVDGALPGVPSVGLAELLKHLERT